jgi:hypothetical protein
MSEPLKRHPNDWDLYTPITPEVIALFERMKVEGDGTWREVAATVGMRTKVLRNVYQANRKTISMRQLDKAITRTGVGNLRDYPWFTAQDLVAMGIWKPIERVDDDSL